MINLIINLITGNICLSDKLHADWQVTYVYYIAEK